MKSIPIWIAVPITVAISLPFGLWLGAWSVPLWAAFIVWAEYFALGAKPEALKIMIPAYISGVIGAAFTMIVSLLIGQVVTAQIVATAVVGDVAWIVGLFVAFIPVIYVMKYLPFTGGQGSLPYFNGISMGLATFFIGTNYITYGGLKLDTVWLLPVITSIPAILAGLLGCFLGWFNVVIMSPFGAKAPEAPAAAATR